MRADVLTSRIEREIFFRTFMRGPRPPPGVAKQFIDAMREELFPAGSVIYRRGTPPEYVHYVVRGKVELSAPDQKPWIFGARSAIGGLDAFQEQPLSRTAVALEDTVILKVRIDDYFDIMEDNFDFAKTMMGVMYGGLEEIARVLPAHLAYPNGDEEPQIAAGAKSLGLVERLVVFRSARAMRRISLQVLVRLAQLAEERRIQADERIWPKGEPSDAMWVVAAGRVRVAREVPSFCAEFGAGSVVAIFTALGLQEPHYDARALTPGLLLRLRKDDFYDVMEDHADLARALLAYGASERVRMQTLNVDANRPLVVPSQGPRAGA